MEKTILQALEDHANLTPAQLAAMCGKETGDVKKLIETYEENGVILGYKTIIDWDKTDREYVSVVGDGKTLEGMEFIGMFGRVVDLIYKIGNQWDTY